MYIRVSTHMTSYGRKNADVTSGARWGLSSTAVSKIHDWFGLCNVVTALDPPFERLFYEDFNGGFRFL